MDTVYLEFSKAFHKILFEILTDKMAKYELDSAGISWTQSWLNNYVQWESVSTFILSCNKC